MIDFIVFSGDLTNTGKTEEFLAAKRELIEPVMEAAGLKDRYDRLFLIPGNHDVDRDIVSLLNQDLYNKPQQVIDEYFIHEKYREVILSPLANYDKFVHELLGGDEQPAKGYVQSFEADCKRKISVIGINTAWSSGLHKDIEGHVDDKGRLRVVESQFGSFLPAAPDAGIYIALMHHPFEWFNQDNDTVDPGTIEDWLRAKCHFVLRGHKHEPRAQSVKDDVGDFVTIAAGSLFAKEDHSEMPPNGYNIVQLNFLTGKGKVFTRHFNNRKHAWVPGDSNTPPDPVGCWTFTLPQGPDRLSPFDGCKILLVDNSKRFLKSRAKVLEVKGKYIVRPASTFAEADRLINSEDFDLAMIDVRMEHDDLLDDEGNKIIDHSGITYSKQVVEMGIPVIMMTVYKEDNDAIIESLTGPNHATDYVFKDDIELFMKKIQLVLRDTP